MPLSTSVKPLGYYLDRPQNWIDRYGNYLEHLSRYDKYNLILLIGCKGSGQEQFPDAADFADFGYSSESAHEEHNVWFSDDEQELLWELCDAMSEQEMLALGRFLMLDLATTRHS